jgi:hypothetical protein
MPSSEVQQQRNNSRSCNEDVLLNIGFSRVGSSSLYMKGNVYILSPGISKGLHGKYWFDIREANLQKVDNGEKLWILPRIVPNWFALFKIDRIHEQMNEKTQDIRANSGLVYGFYCNLDKHNKLVEITAKNDQSASFSVDLLDLTTVKQSLAAEIEI